MDAVAALLTPLTSGGALTLALVGALCVGLTLRAKKHQNALVVVAPGGLPLLNHTLLVLRHAQRAHDWINDYCQAFGDRPFRLTLLGGFSVTIVNTAALFEDVLKTQFECFDKGAQMCDNLSGLLGSGIFAVDGVAWMHQRKTASNLFTMRTLRESMAHTVQDLLPSLDRILREAVGTQAPIDLFKLLNRFTMDAFAKIAFGIELHGLETAEDHPFVAAFDTAQRMVTLRFIVPRFVWKVQQWLNIGSERQLQAQTKVIDDTVLEIIGRSLDQRRTEGLKGSSGKDIVSLFLDDVSCDDTQHDSPFDPAFLRDIVVNFLIAGRDTTAQALSWFFYELHRNPAVETRVRAELKLVLPRLFDPTPQLPTMELVQKLPYLEAALRETLRLHPSVPINFKTANHDTVLSDGTFIPKDSAVCISSYSLGRAKHVWGPDASVFRPERWLDPQHPDKLITVSAFQFNAFHAGPRMCLGMNLAMMEMKMLVASVISKFHLDVVPGHPQGYDLSLTLPMKGPFLTRVQPIGSNFEGLHC